MFGFTLFLFCFVLFFLLYIFFVLIFRYSFIVCYWLFYLVLFLHGFNEKHFFIIHYLSATIFEWLQVVISFYCDRTEENRIQKINLHCDWRFFVNILRLFLLFQVCWLFVLARSLLYELILLSLYFLKIKFIMRQ